METKQLTTQIMSCSEVEVHYKRPLFQKMIYIKGSRDADAILRNCINLERVDLKEFFWVMALTNANRLLVISEIGSGSPKGVAMSVKEIFQLVLKTNASTLIIAHNHPSGSLKPSETDKKFTERLKKVSELMEVTLLDHLIITSESYYSFSDNCLL